MDEGFGNVTKSEVRSEAITTLYLRKEGLEGVVSSQYLTLRSREFDLKLLLRYTNEKRAWGR